MHRDQAIPPSITLSLTNLFVVVTLLMSAPGSPHAQSRRSYREVVVTDKDTARPVVLASNDMLVVKLEGNPSTGYVWRVVSIEPPLLREIRGKENEPELSWRKPNAPGAPCVQLLRFVSNEAGRTTLKLAYQRPWEKEKAPLKAYRLEVRTQGKFSGHDAPP